MQRTTTLLCLLLSVNTLIAQWAGINEVRPFAGGIINFQAPQLVEYTTPKGTVVPWAGAGLEAGVSLTHRGRWGVALSGGIAEHGYLFYLDTACWTMYHQAQRAEARAWWLFPFQPLESAKARIGVAYGLSFQSDSDRRTDQEGFASRMVGREMTRSYIAPEIGMTREVEDHRLEFGVRYVHHLDRTAAWNSYSTSSVGNGTHSGTDDHLAFVFCYHFALPKPDIELPTMPTLDFSGRELDTITTLSTKHSRVVIELWDDAEHDGDTLSVFLNDAPVLVEHELTPKHYRLPVDLGSGANKILVVAHNEGRVPPNTARAFVRTGNDRVHLLIKTSEKRSTALIIHRE